MIPLSILDLSSIVEGGDASQALANTLDLARHVERLGYHRFWLAEHHNMTGIASAATSVVIAHVAGGTSTIRVGAGGIMLPNHAPLVIAEQFGTLAALHPGRIDLGLGRAPGTDPVTTRALRRDPTAADAFPQDVIELMGYFEPAAPGQKVRAVPGAGLRVPIWILGSSLFGAQLAAALGLPYSFASHFAPRLLDEAAALYRKGFMPNGRADALTAPYMMPAVNVIAAATDAEAAHLATSLQQMFVNVRRGHPGPMPPPRAGVLEDLAPWELAGLQEMLGASIIGGPDTVRAGVKAFIQRTGADELIVSSPMYDHSARKRSYEILLDAVGADEVSPGRGSVERAAVG
ncbi:MAG TPA: LLM class flavin-dependent oxidoreductase [Gemmatimonadaceae bacterium]|nr:LLM class flavin-dependent oxidoreductase [Gemmatimonadaceae bacterium]